MSECNKPDDRNVVEKMIDAPQTTQGDQGSITERSLADLIAADRYLRANKLTRRQRISKLYGNRYRPPSARGY